MSPKNLLSAFLLMSVLLGACGSQPTSVPAPALANAPPLPAASSTPANDPCSSENLPAEVKKVHDLTREFDDYSTLASNTPQAQLVQVIPEMQRVLRDAEDQPVPACLQDLKQLQLLHVATVVQTLMAFMAAQDEAAAEQVNLGIVQARDLRLKYDVERARLLGITLAPLPASATATAAP